MVDLLRVHCDWAPGSPADKKHTKVISSWAVHYSRRRQLTAEAKARRGSRPRRLSFGAPSGGRDLLGGRGLSGGGVASPPTSTPEAEAETQTEGTEATAATAPPRTAELRGGTGSGTGQLFTLPENKGQDG